MAHHRSAEKRNRQRITRTLRNKAVKTRVRRVFAQAYLAAQTQAPEAAELARRAGSLLDRAAAKKVLPLKRVARLKSRLARTLKPAS